MTRTPSEPLEGPRRVLVGVFVLASLWYLHWRTGTFNPDAPAFSRVIYAAEVFGFVTAVLHIFMCWRLSVRRAAPARVERSVDVFVPTYNESVELVRKTLLAAVAMDGRHTTWLLDDGRRPEMAALARELGCRYLARADNTHAKAGNLNHALAHSDGELVAVFDADHAPRRDFLARTLGYFDDERVAFVQTPQDFYNLDSYQHRRRGRGRTLWTEQSLFFRVIQRGKDAWNAAFFCGSCAVVRRSALRDIGGFATGTVTEDLHTSLRLHAKGWRSVYHAEALAFGLAPESIEPFIGQRVRWGQGAMHVWRREGILTHRGLTLAQRLNYLASVLTYFDGWQKLVFYAAPVIVLTTGTMPLVTGTADFLLHFVPYYLLTFWVFEEVGRGYGRSLFIEQYNMARFAAFAWATLAWLFPRLKFRVTPKGGARQRTLQFTLPHWLVLGLNLGAIPVGIALYLLAAPLPFEGLVANTLWAGINGALALAVLSFTAVNQRHTRARYRFPVPVAGELVLADGTRIAGTVDDLSESGLRFYGALPPHLAAGAPVTGQLWLPDGALALWGEVRSVIALPGSPQVAKAVGCSFSTTAEALQRLERFLYGSDLQWHVNGYGDQVHTPLSRLLPHLVAGPRPHPLAGRQWNSAQLRIAATAPAEAALVATTPDGAERLLISYRPLPQHQPLLLDTFRRTGAPREAVQLLRVELDAPGAMLHAYRVGAATQPVAAPQAEDAASQARELFGRLRRDRGSPSTFEVDPTTL
ncbi:MAG: glycosyltransferase [Gammaproteobacteria bacterium]